MPAFSPFFSGALMTQAHVTYHQQQFRVKENRLDKAHIRFNNSLTTNGQLRSKIDHLRQERRVFEGIYKKLQRVCWIGHDGLVLTVGNFSSLFITIGADRLQENHGSYH